MKITLNNEELLTLSEMQKKVIQNDIPSSQFESDMKRRLMHVINHPCERFIEKNAQFGREFLKLKGLQYIPSEKMQFASLIFQYAPVSLSEIEKRSHSVMVNDQHFFDISITKKQILKSCVAKNFCCIEWSKQQLKWILQHKYERCMESLRMEWEPKLISQGMTQFPIDDNTFSEIVFKNPQYKNRSQRESSIDSSIL